MQTLSLRTLNFQEMEEIEGGTLAKCLAGIVGSAGLGALTGAGAGSVVPALGTGIGAIAGGIFGGLVGYASFC